MCIFAVLIMLSINESFPPLRGSPVPRLVLFQTLTVLK